MKAVLTFAAVSVATGACSPHQINKDPLPPIAIPKAYQNSGGGGQKTEMWWRDFADNELNRMVATALNDNLRLRAAWARIDQSRALVAQANAGKYPQLELSASAGRQQREDFFTGDTVTENAFNVSLGAGYEVDLWRRIANSGDAAALNALATRDDLEAIAMSIAAEIAEAWFDLVSQYAQRNVLSEQLRTNETYLELVELRFENGLTSALDVYQQRQQVVATRARLGLVDGATKLLEYRLAVLAGKSPGQLAINPGDTFPDLPPVPTTGLPVDLLDRRPDVRAFRRRVEAADHQVAVAIAGRLPSLRLSGEAFIQSLTAGDLIATPLWRLIASVTAPLFDGGRREAEVQRSHAVVQELLMNYAQSLLQAMAEVDSALVQERQQIAYIRDLEDVLKLATSSLTEAQARYSQGLINYLPVLTALQGQQQAELNVLGARRQLLSYRVQLHRALGGTWTQRLRNDPEPTGSSSNHTDTVPPPATGASRGANSRSRPRQS